VKRGAGPLAILLLALSLFGCGNTSGSSSSGDEAAQAGQAKEARKAAQLRHQARVRARAVRRHAHLAALRRQHARERAAQAKAAEARAVEAEEEAAAEEEASSECDPNYSGCLSASAYDYDCAGGSGDGPEYTGTVSVLGEDHYGLDSDSDGVGCESG